MKQNRIKKPIIFCAKEFEMIGKAMLINADFVDVWESVNEN